MNTSVRLAPIDEPMLAALTMVAVSDASADEVSPPLTPGDVWTPERIAWFQQLHRECRAGLDGPAAQATWAILLDGAPVGAVRLQRTDAPGVVETGIWLARSARGRGASAAALQQVISLARELGATSVCADTSAANSAAQATLRRLDFALAAREDGRIHAIRHTL